MQTIIFDDGFEDEEHHQTDVFVIVFEGHNQPLRLLIPTFKRESDIDTFNANPSWKIVEPSGHDIAIKNYPKRKFQLFFSTRYYWWYM